MAIFNSKLLNYQRVWDMYFLFSSGWEHAGHCAWHLMPSISTGHGYHGYVE